MPTRTGTASQANASAGNGSTSVTVPAGANSAVAFVSHFDNNGGSTLSALTIGGNAFAIPAQLAEGATTDENGIGVLTCVSLPASGTQTLAWTWSAGGARLEGGEIVVVWIADGNLADFYRDVDVNATTGSTALSVTTTTISTDLVLAFAERFNDATNGGPNFVLDGTVFIDNASVNNNIYDVSEITPGASSVTVNMTNEQYSSMACISLKEAAAGGAILRKNSLLRVGVGR